MRNKELANIMQENRRVLSELNKVATDLHGSMTSEQLKVFSETIAQSIEANASQLAVFYHRCLQLISNELHQMEKMVTEAPASDKLRFVLETIDQTLALSEAMRQTDDEIS